MAAVVGVTGSRWRESLIANAAWARRGECERERAFPIIKFNSVFFVVVHCVYHVTLLSATTGSYNLGVSSLSSLSRSLCVRHHSM